MSLKSFTDSYIEAALWSTNDESTESGGHPLDKNYGPSDIDQETRHQMATDCSQFYWENERFWGQGADQPGIDDERAGHDFWMDRNDSGTGFWDEDGLSEQNQERLSKASKKFGTFNLYLYSPSHSDWTPDMDNVDEDGDEVEIKIGGSPLKSRANTRRKRSSKKKRGGRRTKRSSRRKR